MNKNEFLDALRRGLCGLPQDDIEERLSFYAEMIDDRMAEGLSETEAVADLGTVERIVLQTVEEIPLGRLVREKIKPIREGSATKIVLLLCGFPIWFPLLVAAVAIIFSLVVSLWCVIGSLWSLTVALGGAGLGGVLSVVPFALQGRALLGAAMVGAGLFSIGLAIFAVPLCVLLTKGGAWLTKKTVLAIKTLIVYGRI